MEKEKIVMNELRFLTYKQVQRITGMSRSTIYRQLKQGKFPRPRILSSRKVGFVQVELEDWIQGRESV